MKCPYCGNELTEGFVQSGRQIFFTENEHCIFLVPNGRDDISLSYHNWTRPTCDAWHCEVCRKIIIDY